MSADGRPFTGPADAFLFDGALHFGTSEQAVRARHLRRNAAVSATRQGWDLWRKEAAL